MGRGFLDCFLTMVNGHSVRLADTGGNSGDLVSCRSLLRDHIESHTGSKIPKVLQLFSSLFDHSALVFIHILVLSQATTGGHQSHTDIPKAPLILTMVKKRKPRPEVRKPPQIRTS